MAVEIRELVIKAIITENDEAKQQASPESVALQHQQLIQECVNQVLRIIKQSQTR